MRFILFITFILAGITGFSQADTLPVSKLWPQYREKASTLLMAVNLQQARNVFQEEYSRKYIEIGMHRTIVATYGYHPRTVLTHGPSIEVSPEKTPIFGFKYGAWAVGSLFSLGVSAIYYTDLHHGNFKIRPEFGFGAYPFRLVMGYNIPTISNASFEKLKRSDGQITFSILLKLKTITRQEW